MEETSLKEKRYPRDSEKTRARILDSALALFSNGSYAHVRSRDIAQRAGVDVALINRYFGSKKGLFYAVLEQLEKERPELSSGDMEKQLCEDFSRRLSGEIYQKTSAAVGFISLSSSNEEVASLLREKITSEIDRISEKLGEADKTSATALLAYTIGMQTLLRMLSEEDRNKLTPEVFLEPIRSIFRLKNK